MLLHQLSRTGSPIHTEDFHPSAAPPAVKDRYSNSHRRLSLQRCSTNCQGQVLQFTPKTLDPALLHRLSRTGSPIHTEDFGSSAAPPTVKDRFSHRRLSQQRFSTNCQEQVLHSHRKLSQQRYSNNCQGQVLQFTPKTFIPALLQQLSRTGSPIHTEDFHSCAAPPSVKDRISKSRRKLSFQRCSTNCQGQDLQIHIEDFDSSAAPPNVKDRISNLHLRLSFQRCSTNCQGQDLQFTPKTLVPTMLHQLSRTCSPIHTENFRSSAAPPFSNSHRILSLQRCSRNCQGQDLQFTPKTFVPALLHQLSRTGCPIHT